MKRFGGSFSTQSSKQYHLISFFMWKISVDVFFPHNLSICYLNLVYALHQATKVAVSERKAIARKANRSFQGIENSFLPVLHITKGSFSHKKGGSLLPIWSSFPTKYAYFFLGLHPLNKMRWRSTAPYFPSHLSNQIHRILFL